MRTLIGQTIGGYLIESALPAGSGGIGQVFRAQPPGGGPLVALKVLHANLASDPKVQERFRREAEVAARLAHPNIVPVYASGEDQGQLYLVMELLRHGSLRGLLQRRATNSWPLALGLDLVRQAAEALAYAHSQGIVHRDIKPDNLLLHRTDATTAPNQLLTGLLGIAPNTAESYVLKVADFGVARVADRTQITSTGRQPGTPAYMAPEQFRSKQVDGRSDLYALGVVLYEIATGALPLDADTPETALFSTLFKTPPLPRSLNPDLPVEVEAIILRCLEKNPDHRYQSAAELAAALQQVQHVLPTQLNQTAPAPRPTTRLGTSASIQVTPDRVSMPLIPGQAETVSVTVTNVGAQVDRYAVAIEGVPATWVSPASQELSLNPNEHGTATFTVLAPRDPANRAGDYSVTITARSQANPGEFGAAQALWSVQPFAGGELQARPAVVEARTRAVYALRVRNDGNVAAHYTLRAEDPRGALRYQFSADGQRIDPARGFSLEPGAERELRLEATGQGRLLGSPMPHAVTVALSGGARPHAVSLQFVQRAAVPSSLLAIVLPLLVLLCGAGSVLANQILIVEPGEATATVVRGTEVAAVAQTAERLRQEQEAERLRQEQEAERIRQEQEAERLRLEQEAERIRLEQEAERLRLEQEAERIRQEQEAERLRLEQEAERIRQEQEAERIRQEQEAERIRQEQEAERLRQEQEAERLRQEQEAEARRRAEEEARRRQEQEAEARRRQEQEAEARRRQEQEAERLRQEQEAEARRRRAAELQPINLWTLAPEALWESGSLLPDGHNVVNRTSLRYPGTYVDEVGFALPANHPLENGRQYQGIEMHPKWVDNGVIKAWFPWRKLPANARVTFEASVGFRNGARNTDGVTFWVWVHRMENGRQVWDPYVQVTKRYTGDLKRIRVDLSEYSGRDVMIELRVDAGNSAGQDWANWVEPRLVFEER